MYRGRVSTQLISSERLDGGFYDPCYARAEAALRASGIKVSRFEAHVERIFKGAFYVLASEYANEGVPFIRVSQLSSGRIDLSSAVYLPPAVHEREHRTAVRAGDVLFAKGGTVGASAVVPEHVHEANISQDVIGARLRPGVDSGFVGAYFASSYGRSLILRWAQGDAQPHLTNDSIRGLTFIEADGLVQKYIGEKVRDAERLREQARELEASFCSDLDVAHGAGYCAERRSSRVSPGELERSLNPGAYAPRRRAVRAALRAAGARLVEEIAEIETPTTDSYLPTTPYVGLDAVDSRTCSLSPSTAQVEQVAGTARRLVEGPALSRLRPYLNKVTYIPPELSGAIGSTELLLVRPKREVDGWFLYGVLKLQSTIEQLNPVATGSTHPRVDREDLLDVFVPWREDQNALGDRLRRAQRSYFVSQRLCGAATTLVERLIEGVVSESDLVAAQAALEAGDRGPDRALLESLRQGDGPDAPPLFRDLDEVYRLIDETSPSSEGDA